MNSGFVGQDIFINLPIEVADVTKKPMGQEVDTRAYQRKEIFWPEAFEKHVMIIFSSDGTWARNLTLKIQ